MQNGLTIQEIELPSVKIKQLYIKWDEKINIYAKDIRILKSSKKSSPLNYKKINNLFTQASLFENWIETIDIKKLRYNDLNASLHFNHLTGGYLNADSSTFSLTSTLEVNSGYLKIKLAKLVNTDKNLLINGAIILDQNMNLILDLSSKIDTVNFDLILYADKENLFYKIDSDEKIKSLKNILAIFNTPHYLDFWLVDAIDMSYATIKTLNGWIDYNDMANAYKNIYADVNLKQLNYTYDTKLDAIHTKYTQIKYIDGVLYINPKEAYSYNQYLDSSKLNIDFSTEHVMLTLYLSFDGVLNKGMHTILQRYKINVPFYQNQGTIKTNLKLTIDLNNLNVDAQGDFFTKKANFDYFALNIDVFDTYMTLDNFDITISQMLAKYKDIATSNVSAKFDAKRSKGKINFDIQSLQLTDLNLSLQDKSLKASYVIDPNKDTITVAKSKWALNDKKINLEKLNLDFDLDTLNLRVPKTLLEVEDISTMYINGLVNVESLKSDLTLNLLNLQYNGVTLTQADSQLKLTYDKKLSLALEEKTLFSFSEKDFYLSKTIADFENKNFHFNTNLTIEKLADTNLDLKYNLDSKKGNVLLSDTAIINGDKDIFSSQDAIDFKISYTDDELLLDSDLIELNFLSNKDVWILNTNSLAKLSPYSKVLKDFNITEGRINVYQKKSSNDINYNASIAYPHKVMVIDNVPVNNYEVYGKIDTKTNTIKADINNLVAVEIKDAIEIKMNNIGIDIHELLNALDTNSSNSGDTKQINLHAKNSYLYISSDRHVISDTIDLKYKDDILTADLKYSDGEANFKYSKDAFYLYGDNFNAKFMEKLFSLSKFKGGRLDFAMSGTPERYDGLFHINNTTIKSYKVLNNVLAFINTIPSLVTFSLPGYNKDGLQVNNAYMKFEAHDDMFDISDIYLNSKEVDILGRGDVSYKNNTIDLDLNLKTDLASTVSKIPVVGYILFDEDSVSTSLKVEGKLTDPDVNSRLAQDIVVAPLNIVKRTLLYPYHLLSGKDNTKNKEQNSTQKR